MNTTAWFKTFVLTFKISMNSIWINKSNWISQFVFALCLLILFPFSFGTQTIKQPTIQIGCFWLIMEFVAALNISRIFTTEQDGNALDILLSSRSSRTAILASKVFFTTLLLFSLYCTILIFWIILFNVNFFQFSNTFSNFILTGFLFSFGSGSLGVFLYALTARSIAKEIIQPILFFPMQSAILLACVTISFQSANVDTLSHALSLKSWWTILTLYPIIFFGLVWIFSFSLLEE